jgi:hypothetical protein
MGLLYTAVKGDDHQSYHAEPAIQTKRKLHISSLLNNAILHLMLNTYAVRGFEALMEVNYITF